MAKITILSELVSNQIAAGEVIERPASIVKELVENSLDAGATSISIEIAGGGTELIRISDNGCGIPFDESILAFERHATSKIVSTQDLMTIETLGFRGEALASIAAVSKVIMRTRERGSDIGTLVEIHGGKLLRHEPCGCPDGTAIEMRDLFYNTPARLKFLKSTKAEAGYIGDYVARLIMCRPDVSIKLKAADKLVYQSLGDGILKNAIYTVYGSEVLSGLKVIDYDDGYINITGYVGIETLAHPTRNRQSFYLNRRYIKSQRLSYALQQAYDTRLMKGRFPFAVAHIKISSSEVDVNVHPNKLDVRFKNEERVLLCLSKAVYKTLTGMQFEPNNGLGNTPQNIGSHELIIRSTYPTDSTALSDVKREYNPPIASSAKTPDASHSTHEYLAGYTAASKALSQKERIAEAPSDNDTDHDSKALVEADHIKTVQKDIDDKKDANKADVLPIIKAPIDESLPNIDILAKVPVKLIKNEPFNIIGCVFETYWIVEQGTDLFYIDHHAAHERKLYEEYINKPISSRSQILLLPLSVTVSAQEHAQLFSNFELFSELGFDIEELGALSIAIRAVPYIFNRAETVDFLHSAIALISSRHKLYKKELIKEKLIQMACKSAVKGGQHIDEAEIRVLLDYFAADGAPLTCPHGRPVLVRIKRSEIEKLFGRIV